MVYLGSPKSRDTVPLRRVGGYVGIAHPLKKNFKKNDLSVWICWIVLAIPLHMLTILSFLRDVHGFEPRKLWQLGVLPHQFRKKVSIGKWKL